jgi:hypothetical protein
MRPIAPGQAPPLLGLGDQVLSSGLGQFVETRLAVVI